MPLQLPYLQGKPILLLLGAVELEQRHPMQEVMDQTLNLHQF
jgi:hypothetical protein